MTNAITATSSTKPLRTALYQCHSRNGAKFVTFAGYEMPIQYPLGVLGEHLHTLLFGWEVGFIRYCFLIWKDDVRRPCARP